MAPSVNDDGRHRASPHASKLPKSRGVAAGLFATILTAMITRLWTSHGAKVAAKQADRAVPAPPSSTTRWPVKAPMRATPAKLPTRSGGAAGVVIITLFATIIAAVVSFAVADRATDAAQKMTLRSERLETGWAFVTLTQDQLTPTRRPCGEYAKRIKLNSSSDAGIELNAAGERTPQRERCPEGYKPRKATKQDWREYDARSDEVNAAYLRATPHASDKQKDLMHVIWVSWQFQYFYREKHSELIALLRRDAQFDASEAPG